jgi:hypothetical protein
MFPKSNALSCAGTNVIQLFVKLGWSVKYTTGFWDGSFIYPCSICPFVPGTRIIYIELSQHPEK